MLVMNNYLPHPMRGLAIAGFLAAFMSTVATQLNWGASYLVSDFYRRFLHPAASNAHYVRSRAWPPSCWSVASAWVCVHLDSIAGGLAGCHGGRRRNRCRLSAALVLVAHQRLVGDLRHGRFTGRDLALHFAHPFHGSSPVVFAKTALTTTIITHSVWLAVTLLTPAGAAESVLEAFYRQVRPDVRGWQPVAAPSSNRWTRAPAPTRDLGRNLQAWLLGCAMVYLCLFGTGKLLLGQPLLGSVLLALSALSAVALYRNFVAGFSKESA